MNHTPSQESQLKPCPFCSDLPSCHEQDPGAPVMKWYYWVECISDKCTVNPGIEAMSEYSLEEAVNEARIRWNTRATRHDAERVIELEKKVEELRKENMDYDYSLTIAKERIAELEKDNVDLLHNLTNYNFRIAELEKQVAAKDEALKWCSEVATNLFNDEYSKDCIRDQYVEIMRRSNEAITSAKSILSGSADSSQYVKRDVLDVAVKALEKIASSGWTKGNIPSEEANELCYLAGKALARLKGME